MKAVRLHKYHEWPTVDEIPEPQITGPHDVIVRIGGAGVCRTDVHVWEGQWAPKTGIELPYTIGHENAGWVHEVGSEVTNVSVGDAVICHPHTTCGLCKPCRDGEDMHCYHNTFPGISTDGGWADLLKTHARSVVPLLDGVEPADVAAHADAGLTAYHATKKAVNSGKLMPGEHAVIIGVGGLGHIGLQTLKAMSAVEITAIDRTDHALELAESYGADHVLRADGTQVDKVLDMTDGLGAAVVFDYVVEADAWQQGFAMTRRNGDHYIIGYGQNIDIPAIDVISTERSFIGNLVGTYNDLAELMVLAQRGLVDLHTQKYPLDQAPEVMQELHHERIPGRAILIP